jgi:putative ABC transport system substrate-binding protein
VIGILSTSAPGSDSRRLAAFFRGLRREGYVEGKNVVIENRWADGVYDRLPGLAADLVRRRVDLIATTGGNAPALAAKAATSTIPIVFTTGGDPVQAGLVASLSHPGGNMTGMSLYSIELVEKRLELLNELVPSARTIALIGAASTEARFSIQHARSAASAIGVNVLAVNSGRRSNFEEAIASAVQQRAEALLLGAIPFFMGHRAQVVDLAARHSLPTIYPWREFTDVGGLMSYGPNLMEGYERIGSYAGRILKGVSPSDLPVHLPTRFELIINLRTATNLGLVVPRLLHARADKAIE